MIDRSNYKYHQLMTAITGTVILFGNRAVCLAEQITFIGQVWDGLEYLVSNDGCGTTTDTHKSTNASTQW
jgi:hypothetical protein